MPKAYLVGQSEILDWDAFQAYATRSEKLLAEYGGRFLARGGRWTHLEGDQTPLSRQVICEFPSYEQALAWYHSEAYAELKQARETCVIARGILIEGSDEG